MRSSGGLRAIAAAVVTGAMLAAVAPGTSALAKADLGGGAKAAAASRLPAAGNPHGHAPVPKAARRVDTSHPNHVIGHGTPASCTSAAVVRAVAKGGIITFNCGPKPVTITMRATAKVVNTSKRVVLDGGGKVALSGAGKRRILYMNTCDKRQKWTTNHCNNQANPQLVVQNLTLRGGNARGSGPRDM